MPKHAGLVLSLGALLLTLSACRPEGRRLPHPPETATTRATAAATTTSPREAPAEKAPAPVTTAPPPPPEPARVDRLLVPGDRVASLVRAEDGLPPRTVFLPGMCGNAKAYLHTFPEAARRHGGVVGVEGDQECAPGYFSFSWDAARLHARVEAALAAAGVSEIPADGITLVGYSQGASLAEQMVQRWPRRYARVVLIGAPTDPSPKNLARSRALVTMSCDRDVPTRMKQAAKSANRAGLPATYFEMPGCTHGNLTDGERIFDETFEWFRANERALEPGAGGPVRIAGSPPS